MHVQNQAASPLRGGLTSQSTQFVTGVTGAVEEHYESFPFGEPWVSESSVSAAQRTAYRFTGKEYDSETGLIYSL